MKTAARFMILLMILYSVVQKIMNVPKKIVLQKKDFVRSAEFLFVQF